MEVGSNNSSSDAAGPVVKTKKGHKPHKRRPKAATVAQREQEAHDACRQLWEVSTGLKVAADGTVGQAPEPLVLTKERIAELRKAVLYEMAHFCTNGFTFMMINGILRQAPLAGDEFSKFVVKPLPNLLAQPYGLDLMHVILSQHKLSSARDEASEDDGAEKVRPQSGGIELLHKALAMMAAAIAYRRCEQEDIEGSDLLCDYIVPELAAIDLFPLVRAGISLDAVVTSPAHAKLVCTLLNPDHPMFRQTPEIALDLCMPLVKNLCCRAVQLATHDWGVQTVLQVIKNPMFRPEIHGFVCNNVVLLGSDSVGKNVVIEYLEAVRKVPREMAVILLDTPARNYSNLVALAANDVGAEVVVAVTKHAKAMVRIMLAEHVRIYTDFLRRVGKRPEIHEWAGQGNFTREDLMLVFDKANQKYIEVTTAEVVETRAPKRWRGTKTPQIASICINFQRGCCRAAGLCNMVHLKADAENQPQRNGSVSSGAGGMPERTTDASTTDYETGSNVSRSTTYSINLEAIPRGNCCPHHDNISPATHSTVDERSSTSTGSPVENTSGGDETSGDSKPRSHTITCPTGESKTVAVKLFMPTAGLTKLSICGNISYRRLCRQHLRNTCSRGEQCNYVHLCRELHAPIYRMGAGHVDDHKALYAQLEDMRLPQLVPILKNLGITCRETLRLRFNKVIGCCSAQEVKRLQTIMSGLRRDPSIRSSVGSTSTHSTGTFVTHSLPPTPTMYRDGDGEDNQGLMSPSADSGSYSSANEGRTKGFGNPSARQSQARSESKPSTGSRKPRSRRSDNRGGSTSAAPSDRNSKSPDPKIGSWGVSAAGNQQHRGAPRGAPAPPVPGYYPGQQAMNYPQPLNFHGAYVDPQHAIGHQAMASHHAPYAMPTYGGYHGGAHLQAPKHYH